VTIDPTPLDPFEVLRLDEGPVDPRPDFAADLRARVLDDLRGGAPMDNTTTSASASASASTASTATTATTATTARPPRIRSVTPYLIVRHGAAALDFYRDAFGAVEVQRFVGDDGRIGHAELTIGDSTVEMADEHPEYDILGPQSLGGTTCSFTLDVDDVDQAFARAVSLGATVDREPADQFHGNRTASVIDPFGHRWRLLAPLAAMSPEEYAAAGAAQGYVVEVGDRAAAGAAAAAVPVADKQLKHYAPGDLYYFTIPVPDLAKAQAFFGAVLGWEFGDPQAGHVSNISAPPGGVRPAAERSDLQLWFVVADIHDAVAKVRAHGGTADEPVLYDSGWAADCVDDQGTTFSLSVPADQYRL
jgi:uncharacterized glyoxalase superfamily protein PhnB